jgi:hypothetical protein
MSKSFAILASALLGAALVGATAVYAQTSSSESKCGPEVYSAATQTYVGVPCNSGETASSTPCKPEGYSSSDQTYTSVPCPAGTTYENPGWKGPKPQ